MDYCHVGLMAMSSCIHFYSCNCDMYRPSEHLVISKIWICQQLHCTMSKYPANLPLWPVEQTHTLRTPLVFRHTFINHRLTSKDLHLVLHNVTHAV